MDPAYAPRKFYQRTAGRPGLAEHGPDRGRPSGAKQRVPGCLRQTRAARHRDRGRLHRRHAAGVPERDGCLGAPSARGARLVSGFRTPHRPTHDGVDLAIARGTLIHAASAGVVVTVLCNVYGVSPAPDGHASPCDHDGGVTVSGCGWYVEIRHAGQPRDPVLPHAAPPAVSVGQPVTAGQPIGLVGMSGNSSGPHLHFEVHPGYPATNDNAINPVPFMAANGVDLMAG